MAYEIRGKLFRAVRSRIVLEPVPQILHHRHGSFYRVSDNSSTERGCSLRCFARRPYDDELMVFYFSRKNRSVELGAFLNYAPDLWNTPPTATRQPDGKIEVTKRMGLQESRINHLCRMQALYKLLDHVFRTWVESFHGDLECCIERKPHVVVRGDEYDDNYGVSEDWDGTGTLDLEGGSDDIDDDRIRSKKLYFSNIFVPVKAYEDKNNVLIWIGKVVSRKLWKKAMCV